MSFPGAEYFLLRAPHACSATLVMCIRQVSREHGVFERGSCCVDMKTCWKVIKLECVLLVMEGVSQFTQK